MLLPMQDQCKQLQTVGLYCLLVQHSQQHTRQQLPLWGQQGLQLPAAKVWLQAVQQLLTGPSYQRMCWPTY